jgi:hypothetical protein
VAGIDLLGRLEVLERLIGGPFRLEERRRDQGRDDGAEDDDRDEDRVRRLVDVSVREPVERGDRSEGQAGRHEQRRVVRIPGRQAERTRGGPDADDLRTDLDREEQPNEAGPRDDRRDRNERSRLEEVERREQ